MMRSLHLSPLSLPLPLSLSPSLSLSLSLSLSPRGCVVQPPLSFLHDEVIGFRDKLESLMPQFRGLVFTLQEMVESRYGTTGEARGCACVV